MQLEIKALHESLDLTVVYVTHDQSEAMTMSNRVAVFNDGIIQQMDSQTDIYERLQKTFVAQFIGENNTLVATQSGTDGDYYLEHWTTAPYYAPSRFARVRPAKKSVCVSARNVFASTPIH